MHLMQNRKYNVIENRDLRLKCIFLCTVFNFILEKSIAIE